MALPTGTTPGAAGLLVAPLTGVGVTRRNAAALKNLIRQEFGGSFDQAFGDSIKAEKAAAAISQALTDYGPWVLNSTQSMVRFNVDQWQNDALGGLSSFGTTNLQGNGTNAAWDEIGNVFFSGLPNDVMKVISQVQANPGGGYGKFLQMTQDKNGAAASYIILADYARVVAGAHYLLKMVAAVGVDQNGTLFAFDTSQAVGSSLNKNRFLLNVLEYDQNLQLSGSVAFQFDRTGTGSIETYTFDYTPSSSNVRWVQIQFQNSASNIGGAPANNTNIRIYDFWMRPGNTFDSGKTTAAGGMSFPTSPRHGHLFYRPDLGGMFTYNMVPATPVWQPAWGGPSVGVRKNTSGENQALTTTAVRLFFSTATQQVGAGVSDPGAQGGWSRITPGIPGRYLIGVTFGVTETSTTSGVGLITAVRINGSDSFVDERYFPAATLANLNVSMAAPVELPNATDFVEVWVSLSSGTANLLFTGTGGGNFSQMNCSLVSPLSHT